MALVHVDSIEKTMGHNQVLRGVSFDVAEGTITTLLGPSGCGKSTTLKCLAGLENPDSGEIRIGDQLIVGRGTLVPTNKRNLGMVFQSYALWPHMSVYDNVAFGLKVRRSERATTRTRVMEALELVGLATYAQSYPAQLSGGQQQRVALARALVYQPRVILLDEPLSNLDAKLRDQMRTEIVRIQREAGITAIYVTHDRTEALSMSDRMCLMQNGRIVQNDHPDVVWSRPRSRYVADFLGMPGLLDCEQSNATVSGSSDGVGEATVTVEGQRIVATIHPETRHLLRESPRTCLLLDMPKVTLATEDGTSDTGGTGSATDQPAAGVNRLHGTVTTRALVGDMVELDIGVGSQHVKVRRDSFRVSAESGDRVRLDFTAAQAQVLFDGDLSEADAGSAGSAETNRADSSGANGNGAAA